MNTNKQLLLDIATRLTDSTKTSWDRGDLEQWANHAKSMKTTIISVVPILKTISEEFKPIPNETKPTEQKVIIMDGSANHINDLLKEGWRVKSVTPLSISTDSKAKGEYCIVIER